MSAAAGYDPEPGGDASGAFRGWNAPMHRSGAERLAEQWADNPAESTPGHSSGSSFIDAVLGPADPGPDELLKNIKGLAAELDYCIVRLAQASSAGIADRELRAANGSAAEWVRRTLEDIVATSAGIRFAGQHQPATPTREDLPAAG